MDDGKYKTTDQQGAQIERGFTYHKPTGAQPERYTQLRANARDLAYLFTRLAPPSRELSVALTKLEESVMWANAAIARNEVPVVEPVTAPDYDPDGR